jgi:tRNA-specific 2-thiouridylase
MQNLTMTKNEKSVLIGMSGGVDSTAAALLLAQKGYQVTGLFLDVLGNQTKEAAAARDLSERLGIGFLVKNIADEFDDRIIRYFCDSFADGLTPNPCVLCNPTVKFRILAETADAIGASRIATGHYARVLYDSNDEIYYINKANAASKDQSYMLYRLPQSILSRILFPLGEVSSKEEIRQLVRTHQIGNEEKKDSQEICFVKNGDYADFIYRRGYLAPPGDFIDSDGSILGRHKGLIHYTVGQRKGLGMTFGKPMFVTAIDKEKNTVTLGSDGELFSKEVIGRDFIFTGHETEVERIPANLVGQGIQAKIRYAAKPADAVISQIDPDELTVHFNEPQRAPTPGQSIVFYAGDRLLGGAVIKGE